MSTEDQDAEAGPSNPPPPLRLVVGKLFSIELQFSHFLSVNYSPHTFYL